MKGDIGPAWRAPLLILAVLSLLIGIGAGLMRLGWTVPLPAGDAVLYHGPLMVCGFFGTVIGLERAVALRQWWVYLGPLFSGVGGLFLLAAAPPAWSATLMTVASCVFLAGSVQVFARQRALFTFTLALGAACWLAGNISWLAGRALWTAVPCWIGFLVLTIAGERLELSRFLPPSLLAKRLFAVILMGLIAGIALSAGEAAPGPVLVSAVLLALSVWLLRQDIARRTVMQQGLTRFIAVCLLAGYAWLAVGSGIALAAGGLAPGGPAYDAALHAILLGFVFSMVFGHAPIIFPAVLRLPVPYTPFAYVPLAVLAASLTIRTAGAIQADAAWRSVGGLLNALALALFLLGTVGTIVYGARKRGMPPAV